MLIYLLLPHSPVPPALLCPCTANFGFGLLGSNLGFVSLILSVKNRINLGRVGWVQLDELASTQGPINWAQTFATPLTPVPSALTLRNATRAACALVQKVHNIQLNWKLVQSNSFLFYSCQICKAPATPILPPVLTLRYANPSCMRVGAKRPPHSIT